MTKALIEAAAPRLDSTGRRVHLRIHEFEPITAVKRTWCSNASAGISKPMAAYHPLQEDKTGNVPEWRIAAVLAADCWEDPKWEYMGSCPDCISSTTW